MTRPRHLKATDPNTDGYQLALAALSRFLARETGRQFVPKERLPAAIDAITDACWNLGHNGSMRWQLQHVFAFLLKERVLPHRATSAERLACYYPHQVDPDKLQALRKQAGLSQEAFVAACRKRGLKLSSQLVGDFVRRKSAHGARITFTGQAAITFADALGVNLEALERGELPDDKQPVATPEGSAAEPEPVPEARPELPPNATCPTLDPELQVLRAMLGRIEELFGRREGLALKLRCAALEAENERLNRLVKSQHEQINTLMEGR